MNSSTAAANGEEGADPLRLKKSTNCLTDSCSSGESELMTAARFSAAIFAFHPQYTLPKTVAPLVSNRRTFLTHAGILDFVEYTHVSIRAGIGGGIYRRRF